MFQDDFTSLMPHRLTQRLAWAGLSLLCVSLWTGCSKDEMKQMATSVQQTTQDLATQSQEYVQGKVEKIENQLPSTGSVGLKLDPEIEIESATLEVIKIGDGRSNVMQLATYDTSSDPSKFPALLLHGQTTVDTVSGLVGETVACDLYVQTGNGADVLMTPAGSSVQVIFRTINKKKGTMTASIGSGTLVSSANKKVNLNGGNAIALLKGGSQ